MDGKLKAWLLGGAIGVATLCMKPDVMPRGMETFSAGNIAIAVGGIFVLHFLTRKVGG